MELMLLPSGAATARPLLPTARLRRACLARPAAASSSNVEVINTSAASTSTSGWRAGRHGLELDLSDEMRRGMMWRMLAPPAAAVAADAAFLRLLDRAAPADVVPAWAAAAGSAVLFAVGLLGVHYGFLSSRWDAAEKGSLVGWDLAVRHWNVMSMAKEYSSSVLEQDEDGKEEEYEDDDDEEYEDEDDEEESD